MAQCYLASQSPRRQQLLSQLKLTFTPLPITIPETQHPSETATNYVQRLAREKALSGLQHPDRILPVPVLGADTIVILDQEILQKPRDADDAERMLAKLSGQTHQVLTAMSLVDDKRQMTRLSVSEVSFRKLKATEITAYVQSGEPLDKAGSYAIQGLGAVFIEKLIGSYSAVMGLGLYETAGLLNDFGIVILA